jgi:pyruvate-formate lyase-activating enzyme
MRSQAALAHALIGVKVINLLIAKHEYLRSSVATCARPIGFMLDPANQCHLGCPSCVNSYNTKVVESNYNKWPRGLMSRETFGTFLREVGLYAFSGAFYNNHEPLLNRHTPEFLELTSDLHVRTFISSNLSFRRIDAEEIVASGLTELMVAADGVSQDVYERYRRGGKIEWVLENARAIAEAKRRLKSRTPIMRWQYLTFEHNVHEIERALQLAREIGFDSFNLATPNEVSFDDPSIECVNYSGQKSFELRPREFLAFSRDLEPHRAMIEKALEESAADRRLRETGGHDGVTRRVSGAIGCIWPSFRMPWGALCRAATRTTKTTGDLCWPISRLPMAT